MKWIFYLVVSFYSLSFCEGVELGVDLFFAKKYYLQLKGKRVGLVTNHTGIDKSLESTIQKFKSNAKDYNLVAIFSPEHGVEGMAYAWEEVSDCKDSDNIPIYSLHGKIRRPTDEMLKNVDVLVYDIQDIGSRSYTYSATLFYVMEAAAKRKIPLIVLDRPNPIGGRIVDGPMLEEKWRSFIGYINVPYCHGMTIGELALFFNKEYRIGCRLTIIPMRGWRRHMSFYDTKLCWIPPSPHIPEADTAFFYPSTGILGELKIVNIGIGYTLPFKVVGAPWIEANKFAEKLNEQKLPGVKFIPFHFRPFYGLYQKEDCNGVLIEIIDKSKYKPLAVQYLLLGMLKSLYPKDFLFRLKISAKTTDIFCKANGTDQVLKILKEEKYPAWKLIEFQSKERGKFLEKRKKYLIPQYGP